MSEVFSIAGLELSSVKAGIKYADRLDLTVMRFPETASVSAVFTQNRFCAAPVTIAKAHLATATHCVINTGYANAGTGDRGYQDAIAVCQHLADQEGVSLNQIMPFSTGVIGEYFPVEKLTSGIDAALGNWSEDTWAIAGEAIMTTDTRLKLRSTEVEINNKRIAITGISKGAGMIKPNMATMLGFVATDAQIEQDVLDSLMSEAANQSFNRITVDGDTSTNDACVLVATGRGDALTTEQELMEFKAALNTLMRELALDIIRDGEGATKCIEVKVSEGKSAADCLEVAYTVAHSPLVKTAFFACDPNWGRILAAIGRADIESLDVNKVSIALNGYCIVENGALAADYQEAEAAKIMQETDIQIAISLNEGEAEDTVWTTDFSYDYVKINAEYRS